MRDIYDQLGVRKYINAYGTVTKYGGSIMDPLVLDAMREASRSFVDLVDLQQRAGKRLAELLGVEAAYITTGAAAGIVLSVAACITGNDPEYIRRIPNTEGMKNEIIILKAHSCQYEQQVRQAGGNIVEIGQSKRTELWELNRAINPNTAGILYFAESAFLRGSLPLKDIISVAKERNVPVLVDAAAEIPPVKNLTSYLEMGADLVQFSGGKDIRGPQSSGFIIGKKHLIEACALNSNPHAAVGRPFKVDKETIVGLLKAVEIYLQQDFDEEMKMWAKQTDYIADQLSQISELGVRVGLGISPGIQPESIPRTYLTWDEEMINLTKDEFVNLLKVGNPGIVVSTFPAEGVDINPQMLNPGEEVIVVDKIKQIFQQKMAES